MVTLITLSVICLVAVIIIPICLTLIGLPLLILLEFLPWLLRVAGVILLLKAIFQKPVTWENFLPALAAFVAAAVLGWFF